MYRCEICDAVSPPGSPRLVHVVQREVPRQLRGINDPPTRLEVEREVAVCKRHHDILKREEMGLADLFTLNRPREAASVAPMPKPIQMPATEAAHVVQPVEW